ncbi:MAG: hypothetical protein H6817_00310 [Phycisphaerales bacterium]|nr:hypothetical protein [Phycisphaerales bacterium]
MNEITIDSNDVTIALFAVDALTGVPVTGLAYGDVTARYVRTRAAAVAVSPVSLASVSAAHADGGFIEIDASGAAGWYRFDVPDAAFASGADDVLIVLQADGMLVSAYRARLVADMAGDVHLCKAALVNKRVHTVSTGVDVIKDDDGTTTLVTLTPTDGGDDLIEVVPS